MSRVATDSGVNITPGRVTCAVTGGATSIVLGPHSYSNITGYNGTKVLTWQQRPEQFNNWYYAATGTITADYQWMGGPVEQRVSNYCRAVVWFGESQLAFEEWLVSGDSMPYYIAQTIVNTAGPYDLWTGSQDCLLPDYVTYCSTWALSGWAA